MLKFISIHFIFCLSTAPPKKSHKQALIARRFIKDWGISALNTVGIGEFELNTPHMRDTGNNLSFHSFIKMFQVHSLLNENLIPSWVLLVSSPEYTVHVLNAIVLDLHDITCTS